MTQINIYGTELLADQHPKNFTQRMRYRCINCGQVYDKDEFNQITNDISYRQYLCPKCQNNSWDFYLEVE